MTALGFKPTIQSQLHVTFLKMLYMRYINTNITSHWNNLIGIDWISVLVTFYWLFNWYHIMIFCQVVFVMDTMTRQFWCFSGAMWFDLGLKNMTKCKRLFLLWSLMLRDSTCSHIQQWRQAIHPHITKNIYNRTLPGWHVWWLQLLQKLLCAQYLCNLDRTLKQFLWLSWTEGRVRLVCLVKICCCQ